MSLVAVFWRGRRLFSSGRVLGRWRGRGRVFAGVGVVVCLAAGALALSVPAVAQSARDSATDMGDITDEGAAQVVSGSLSGSVGEWAWWQFTLAEPKTVALSLWRLDADADLVLEDADGNEVAASRQSGTTGEGVKESLSAGTYFVGAEAVEAGANDFTVRRRVKPASGAVRETAFELGDITDETGVLLADASLWGAVGAQAWWQFSLAEPKTVSLKLRRLDADADLVLEDADGNEVAASRLSGTTIERIEESLSAGTYFVRAEAVEAGANDLEMRRVVKAADEDDDSDQEADSDDDADEDADDADDDDADEDEDDDADREADEGTQSERDPDPQEGPLAPRGHGTPLPWTGHTVHDIEVTQTHELTSASPEIWYRMSGMESSRAYLFQKSNIRGSFVNRPRIEIYESGGDLAKQQGHSDLDAIGEAFTWRDYFGHTVRFGTWLNWVPPTDGTYYLRFYSTRNDTGSYRLRMTSKEFGTFGDSNSGEMDCNDVFNDPTCHIEVGETSIAGKVHLKNREEAGMKDTDIWRAFLFEGKDYRMCVSSTDDGFLSLRPALAMWLGESRVNGQGTADVCKTFEAPWTDWFDFHVYTRNGDASNDQVSTFTAISNYTLSLVED